MAVNKQKFKLIFFISLFVCVNSWKLCNQTFCERIRKRPEDQSRDVKLDFSPTVLKLSNKSVETNLNVESNSQNLKFKLEVVGDSSFHIFIDQTTNPRQQAASKALVENLPPLEIDPKRINTSLVTVTHENKKALIFSSPFKIEFYNNDTLVSIVNWNNSLIFKTDNQREIALDILFPNVQRAYGIPEHADRLTLQNTIYNEPYRLYNLDYGNYRVNSVEALYGSIPVLYAHGVEQSSGIFWLNPSQTWIDVTTTPDEVDAYFMSEDGPMDVYILMGPTLQQAVTQYTKLTGTAPLPQYFTLGYHQSRYSYRSQDEVISVVNNFDDYNLPVDVLWLDIDYTDNKKYFTWDKERFKQPEKLLNDLKSTNRTLVAIIDPHFKNDGNYDIHVTAQKSNYYVKKSDGDDYSDKCWPGLSSWIDFLNPQALEFYANLYARTGFRHPNIHIWNDMNEPAVFNDHDASLEKTMPPDLLHYGDRKHKEVHNIYGFYQTVGTQTGLLKNHPNLRPFILTRSHFAGIQRYAAIWTGDNYASWEHLQISFPMCLTEALAGVSFCGADVGGFGGIPSDELYQRWYQAGAWLPFFRGHSAIDVPRREPYLYPEGIQARVRTALHQRYAHLPLWYTLFWEHELTGEPVIRPITYHYPQEVDALSIDNQILAGPNVLIAPVLEPGVSSKKVYLPGGNSQIWYNIDDNNEPFEGSGYHTINVNLNSTPVFYRAGSIIPRKDILRPTAVGTYSDPFTLYICLNSTGEANGTLYVDDYESFQYRDSKFLYTTLIFSNNILSSHLQEGATYSPLAKIEQLIILNPPKDVKEVKYTADEDSTTATSIQYDNERNLLDITGIAIDLQKKFQVEFLEDKSNDATISKLSSWMLVVIIASFVLMKM